MSNELDNLAKTWRILSPEKKLRILLDSDPAMQKTLATDWSFLARDDQYPPQEFGVERGIWMCLAGRGWGKTRCAVEWIVKEILESEDPLRIAAINKNESDVRSISIEGESGVLATLKRHGYAEKTPEVQGDKWYSYNRTAGRMSIEFPNGSLIQFFSAEKPDRLAGFQFNHAWLDELALYEKTQEVWDQLQFTLRLGENNKILITTTPRPKPLLRWLRSNEDVIVTAGATYDNLANLSGAFRKSIVAQFEGTRIGRQELYGELLFDNPDGLFPMEMVEKFRTPYYDTPKEAIKKLNLERIVVAIDPAVTSGEEADNTGIVVVGLDSDGIGYMLEDLTMRGRPKEWAYKAIHAYYRWQADLIVAEVNQGGEMVEETLRQLDPRIPYKAVRASKGKRTRAEPIAALYEQGRVAHMGKFDELEDEMLMFTPDGKLIKSPDRVDALVWGLTEVMLGSQFDGTIEWV